MTELCVLYIIILLNYIMSETLVLSYSHGYHDKEFKHPESLMKVYSIFPETAILWPSGAEDERNSVLSGRVNK